MEVAYQFVLIYMQARYYDPVIGRFYSNDPVDALSYLSTPNSIHGFNRYAYANNNPYKYTDPDGKMSTPYSMSQNAARVRELDAGKPAGVIAMRHTKMLLGAVAIVSSGGAALPVVAGAITFGDGVMEGSVVSSALQEAGVSENAADSIASGVDLALGAKGLADGAADLGKTFLKSDDAADLAGGTVNITADFAVAQVELDGNLKNISEAFKKDENN